jgi:hypothetical protein
MKLNALAKLGFEEVGGCKLDHSLKSQIRFTVTRLKDERVIYAFAVDDEVKYVGVCDTSNTSLGARMNRYQGMLGTGTNERITGHLSRALSHGSVVRILAWKPQEDFRVGPLRVDLVKGLENPLIALAEPEWNIHA